MWTRMPVGEESGRSIPTATAKGCEFFHRVREGDALEQVALKRTAVRVSIESYEVEVLLVRVHHPLYKGNEALKKLSFVDDENLEAEDILQSNIVEVAHSNARSSLIVVRGNLILAIPDVICMLNHEDRHIECGIPRQDA